MIKRLTAAVLLAAALNLTAGAATAAPPKKIGAKVSIDFKNNGQFVFFGKVESKSGRCERGRQVTVFREQEGNDFPVGGDKADSGGRYKVDAGGSVMVNTNYYAKVAKKELDGALCKATRSKNFQIED